MLRDEERIRPHEGRISELLETGKRCEKLRTDIGLALAIRREGEDSKPPQRS
jgi:hypothetical protein